jgi:hypothetical protein
MEDVVKKANFSSDYLLSFVREKKLKLLYIKDCHKILLPLSEEQGLILERSGMDAFVLNVLAGNGFGFKSKPMMILEKGRPESNENRLLKEIRSYDFLDPLGVEYTRVDHEHADTMEICAEIEKVLGCGICKNLFL